MIKKKWLMLTRNTEDNLNEMQNKYWKNLEKLKKELNILDDGEQILYLYTITKEIKEEIKKKYEELKYPSTKSLPELFKHGLGISLHSKISKKWVENNLEVYDEHLIFSTRTFKAFKLNFVPQKLDDVWQIIQHHVDVFATRNDTYVIMNSEEWNDCWQEEEDLHICKKSIFLKEDSTPSCLLQYVKKLPPRD